MFADLEVGALTRVLRPTIVSALVAGLIAVAVAMLLGSPLGAAGIVLGVGMAVLNLRMLGARVTRTDLSSGPVTSAGHPGAVLTSSGEAPVTTGTAPAVTVAADGAAAAAAAPQTRDDLIISTVASEPAAGKDDSGPAGPAQVRDELAPNKVVRRILRTHSALRLALITVVAVGLVLVRPPLGIGAVVGLVIFQIAFVANAGRAILSAQIS